MNSAEGIKADSSVEIRDRVSSSLTYAILSLVLVIFTFGIGSLILSAITLGKIKKLGKDCPPELQKRLNASKALAIIGLVASIFMIIAVIVAVTLILAVIIILCVKTLLELCIAAIALIISFLSPFIGVAISQLIVSLITALVEWLVEALPGGAATLMLIL